MSPLAGVPLLRVWSASADPPGLGGVQNLGPALDLLSQNIHFSKIPLVMLPLQPGKPRARHVAVPEESLGCL